MSVLEIAEMIIELSGSSSELVYEPLPEDDPKRRCPEIRRARGAFGWEPRTPVREGLKRTLIWFAERTKRADSRQSLNRYGVANGHSGDLSTSLRRGVYGG